MQLPTAEPAEPVKTNLVETTDLTDNGERIAEPLFSRVGMKPDDILGPQGRIAARLANYEHRQQQLEMAQAVYAALQQGRHLIVEAGTGVGKSFAYLVPAILATADEPQDDSDTQRRILISTHTISLQEQLTQKDLPFLNSVIPLEFTAVLAKGRGNYLSKRRLRSAAKREKSLFVQDDPVAQLRSIHDWADKTTDGTMADLSFRPLSQVWDEVRSDHGNCMGRNCPTYSQCFYYAARRRLQHAQLIIVNHALFFSDLALRQAGVSILPNYDAVIFDEAHMMDEVASDHLGTRITSSQIDYLLNKLYNDRTNKGLLVHHGWQECQQQVDACRIRADDFFEDIQQWVNRQQKDQVRVPESDQFLNPLSEAMERLVGMLRRRLEDTDTQEEKQDIVSAMDKIQLTAAELRAWISQDFVGAVYWVEISRGRRSNVTLACAPLDLGPTLREQMFEQIPSVVMTSATLATGDPPSFEFFQRRIGLTQAETLQLGSPFDYRRQAKIIVPQGIADPVQQSRRFEQQTVSAIKHHARESDGRCFVLLTSYQMLRSLASALTPWLAREQMGLLTQGEDLSRTQMIERFKANPRSVLLGTASFWQGVDIPGDALRTVIIVRLPFSVPDQPLLAARLDQIRAAGGNPFMEYQLPEAIIKLKQGFGRLIRTASDTGEVVILDPRIRTKRYGQLFLKSLPDCEILHPRLASELD